MAYNILFIDEESSQQERFLDYFEKVYPEIVPKCVFPEAYLEEMLEKVSEIHPDAVVTDFVLNEIKTDISYNVNYTGIELVDAIHKHREGFPCFIITSFDDTAVDATDDVNLVYIKDVLNTKKGTSKDTSKVTFAQRIISQVDKYRSKIDNAKEELLALVEKREKGQAGADDESRIIKLDSFLEKSLDSYSALPPELKELSNIDRLNELIEKTDALLKKLE
jgi:hypothetical protein